MIQFLTFIEIFVPKKNEDGSLAIFLSIHTLHIYILYFVLNESLITHVAPRLGVNYITITLQFS